MILVCAPGFPTSLLSKLSKHSLLHIFIFLQLIYVRGAWKRHSSCVEAGAEEGGEFEQSVLSFHYVGPGDQTRVLGFGV